MEKFKILIFMVVILLYQLGLEELASDPAVAIFSDLFDLNFIKNGFEFFVKMAKPLAGATQGERNFNIIYKRIYAANFQPLKFNP